MAVPKKRTPRSRRNARRSVWFQKAIKKGKQALAFSKSWASNPSSVNKKKDSQYFFYTSKGVVYKQFFYLSILHLLITQFYYMLVTHNF